MWNTRSCSMPEQTSKPGVGGEAEAGLNLCGKGRARSPAGNESSAVRRQDRGLRLETEA